MKDNFNCRVDATYVNDGDKWDGALHYTDNEGKDVYSTKKTSNAKNIEEVYLDLIGKIFAAGKESPKKEQTESEKLDQILKRLEFVEKRLADIQQSQSEKHCCGNPFADSQLRTVFIPKKRN